MKKISVPILTEEYSIIVYIGTLQEIAEQGGLYLDLEKRIMDEMLKGKRGIAYNTFRAGINKDPIILIDGDHEYREAIATIAHEASHAMDYIQEYLGIDDRAGEVHAHGIASVMRHALTLLKPKVL